MDAIDLAVLDDTQPPSLDPAIWSANLGALRIEQPELAGELERTPLPPHWRPATALDGFATYRVEPPGQPPQWLAGTSAPLTRASAVLRYDQIGDRNPALPTIAAGAELKLLLEWLSTQQAVFVFEEVSTRLVAVLRALELAPAIAAGRCVLVPPGREQAFLEELLDRYPGLVPPGTLVALPGVSGELLERLRTVCEIAARKIDDARGRRIQALRERIAARGMPARSVGMSGHRGQPLTDRAVKPASRQPARRDADAPPARQPRLAVLALGPNPRSHHLGDELAAAAGQLNWAVCSCVAGGPRQAHVLPHCEQLADFAAQLAICVDHSPESLPLPAGKVACHWHLHTKDVRESLPDDDTIHLAATPRVEQALRLAGVPAQRNLELYWGYPSAVRTAKRPAGSGRTVAIVGDLPDASAGACRIEQPTHRQLWGQLHRVAADVWHTPEITRPTALLRTAERASGVELSEAGLRKQMLRIIEHVLIPAVVLERICQRLRDESFDLVAVGSGWQRCASEFLSPLTERLYARPEQVVAEPVLAAVFAGPLDPLNAELFYAAAIDWPLLLHKPGGESLTARLGGILHPRQHYDPFAGHHDLIDALNALRADPQRARERCANVREHLKQQHTYAHRLESLARQFRRPSSEAFT